MADDCRVEHTQIVKVDTEEAPGCVVDIDGKRVFLNQEDGISGVTEDVTGFDTTEIDAERAELLDKITRCKDATEGVIDEIAELSARYTKVRTARFRLTEVMDNAAPVFKYHKRRFERYSELIQLFTQHYNKERDKALEVAAKQNELNQFAEYYNGLINPSQTDVDQLNALSQQLTQLNSDYQVIVSTYVTDLKTYVYYLDLQTVEEITTASITYLSTDIVSYAQNLSLQSNNYSTALDVQFNQYFDEVLNRLNSVNIFRSTVLIKNMQDIADNEEITVRSIFAPDDLAEFYFQSIPAEQLITGALYSTYYDLLQDPIANLFTLEERGLTLDVGGIDRAVLDEVDMGGKQFGVDVTGMSKFVYNDTTYYIHDREVFQEFFTNFPDKLEAKLQWLRTHTVDPLTNAISEGYVGLAEREAKYYVANSLVNDFQMADMISRSEGVVIKYNALAAEIQRLTQLELDIKQQMSPDSIKERLKSDVECIEEASVQDPPTDNGQGLKSSFGRFDEATGKVVDTPSPYKPNPTKNCYWNRFSLLATQYGLLPFVDPMPKTPGLGMRYWPVGFQLPTPAGLVKIPLPMIWIPLFVLGTPFGIIVLFLNVCGIFPSPMLFFIGNPGTKKFILTMRGPSDEVGCSSKFGGVTSNLLKPLSISADIDIRRAGEVLSKNDSIDEFKSELINKILQKLDSLGNPDMSSTNALKLNFNSGMEIDVPDVSNALREDAVNHIKKIDLPTIRIPKDDGTTKQKDGFEKVLNIGDAFKLEKFKAPTLEGKPMDLREKLKLVAIDLYEDTGLNGKVLNTPTLDLRKDADFIKFRDFFSDFLGKLGEKLKNASILQSLATFPDTISVNSFVCQEVQVPLPPDIPALGLITAYQGLVAGVLSNLTSADVIQLLGFNELSSDKLFSAALMSMMKFVPEIPMPPTDFDFNFGALFKSIAMSLAVTMIPKISLPLGLPDHINVDLNAYMDGIANIVDKNLIKYMNLLPTGTIGDPGEFLTGVSGVDLKLLLNYVIGAEIEPLLAPVLNILKSFNAISAFRGFEINQLEIIMDPTSVWSKFQQMLGEDMNLGKQIPLSSPDLISAAMELIKSLENVPYPIVGALACYGNSEVIRNLHPMLRCDDLPPWERLTLENILFVVFLDDFCHNGKIKGGFFENFYP